MTTDQASSPPDALAFDGEMTIYSAAANFQRLKDHIGKRLPLHLDLSAVNEIDSSGIQILLYAQSEANARELEFSLTGIGESVEDALSLLFLKRTLGMQTATQPETSA
ncbi:anti-anti-sigma factor [Thiorhodovibrio winogradskyi]|uniref:Anti-anti-sigma factor n=1 Tax=Thiorhodovibrio winogradskyi TaxID=77007 RepID=A0ABZ0SG07_9GAMM|nr:STAS domain-containing protein [Thiorhodovibrio winogradskyi]